MMQKIVLLLPLLCALGSFPVDAQVARGMTATVGAWEWVTVVNTTPVTQRYRNATVALDRHETCGIEVGGTVTVLGSDAEGLLVEYTAPGSPMGTPCPSGVRFLTTHAHFQSMTATYERKRQAMQTEQERIQRLLQPQ